MRGGRVALCAGVMLGTWVFFTPEPVSAQSFCINVRGIGGCISSGPRYKPRQQKRQYKSQTSTRQKKAASATVRDDATIQKALTALGFDTGGADGVFGAKTRTAIKSYQASINEPQTGSLTPQQRANLLATYAKLASGGTLVAGGGSAAVTTASASTFLNQIRNQAPTVFSDAPAPATASKPGGTAVAQSGEQLSIAQLCGDDVAANEAASIEIGKTLSGGEVQKLFADQFCTVRSYVLREIEQKISGPNGLNMEATAKQCDAYIEPRKDEALSIAASAPKDTIERTKEKLVEAGVDDFDKVIDGVETCLGFALMREKPSDVAIFATHLASLGENKYGEILGEQLALGLGVDQNPDVARQWLEWTIEALESGSEALIVIPDYDHVPLLRALADQVDAIGGEPPAATSVATSIVLPGMEPAPPSGVPASLAASSYAMRKGLPSLEVALDMERDRLVALCQEMGSPAPEIALRTCRAVAYAAQDLAMMRKIDEQLAGLGDADAKLALSSY